MGDTFHVAVFFIVLIIAAYTDLKYETLPNWLTFSATLIGCFFGYIHDGIYGVGFAILGWFIGFLPFYLLYIMKGIGAGDVKLMAAVGALGGPKLIIYSFWYTSIAGFLMALALLIWKKKLLWGVKKTSNLFLKSLGIKSASFQEKSEEALSIPYGLAIVFGSYIAFFNTAI